MTWLAYLVVIATTVFVVTARHNAVFKSVHQANLECQQYLSGGATNNDTAESCELRCEQLVLRSWSDESGLICASYQRYFRPTCDDPDNRNRTRMCIKKGWRLEADVCSLAARAAQCCREQLGFLESRSPKILQTTKVLVTGYLRQCARILGVSKGEFQLYQAVWFQFPDKARRLLRCLVLRLGVYSDVRGWDVDEVFLQFVELDIVEQGFKESFRECADRVQQSENKGHQLSQTFFHCIPWDVSNRTHLLPTKPEQCQQALRDNCQIQCSPQTVANLCHVPGKLSQAKLSEVLNKLHVNDEGLLLPSAKLSRLPAKTISECASARLNECLADCSTLGIQLICAQP